MRASALALALLAALAVAGCRERGGDAEPASPTRTQAADTPGPTVVRLPAATATPVPDDTPTDYTDPNRWICRPGKPATPCTDDLTAMVLEPGGAASVVTVRPLADAPIDCFYVYPTVSTDRSVNSDLQPDAAERNTVLAQAAPFGQACRVFAPVYRQLTVSALTSGRFGDSQAGARAYSDVVGAWQHYLANDNGGRRVVLIGHSQGASVLERLIAEHVDTYPEARALLAGAILLGTSVSVPEGKSVGGDFKSIPGCGPEQHSGCVVSYASFNAASPPPAASLFGRASGAGNQALCTDAAKLSGKPAELWIPASGFRLSARTGPAAALSPDTTFVVYRGLADVECRRTNAHSYLAVAVNAAGAAWGVALPPYINGEVWGLHNLDVSLLMGNLVALVEGWAP